MSKQATTWVLEHSKSESTTRCVLFAIAWRMGPNGEGWAYVADICQKANCSIKTYRRAVQWAEANGELKRDVKAGAAPRAAGNHKPNLFRLAIETLPSCHPPKWETSPNGEGLDPPKVARSTPFRPSQVVTPEKQLTTTTESPRKTTTRAPRFDEFYAAYPRHIGKRAAEKAWNSATKRADPAVIVAAAVVYRDARNGHDPKFTPYPSTWLNRDSWCDEPDEGVVLADSTHTINRWLQRTENHDPNRGSNALGNDGGRLFAPGD